MTPRRLVSVLLALTLASACSSIRPALDSEPPPAPATADAPGPEAGASGGFDAASPIPLDPAVVEGSLDNGLTYYIRENGKPARRAELRLVVDAGSVLEDDDQRGLAHFVEHMAFNGTAGFEKQALIEYLERIGMRFGPDINAYTSFDETVYMLEVPTDDGEVVDTALRILRDWAGEISFEGKDIDDERGVVVEEWRLGRGSSGRIRDAQFPLIFKGSRYAERLPIGSREVLENAPHDVIRRFYADWYRPDLMAVVAVGDFDAADIERRIRDLFATLAAPDETRQRPEFPVPDHDETLVSVVTDEEATAVRLSVMYKRPPVSFETVGQLRQRLVEQLYNVMMNARLSELRQQADPPFQFGSAGSGMLARTKSMYQLSAVVRDGGVERGLRALLKEARRVERHGFTVTELERARVELARVVQRQYEERDRQESRTLASQYVQYFLGQSPAPSIEYLRDLLDEVLPTVMLAEINALADEWITEDNRVVLVSGPDKQESGIPAEERLLALFDEVDAIEVSPWIDKVRDEPLVGSPPEPGAVVREETIPELDVTRWELANGATVLVKPTDFKNDEILLFGESDGGHSLVPDEEFLSASEASSIVMLMGAGSFSRIELEKALAGKLAGVSTFIGELSEGVSGSASPRDLETMLRLLYLRFTAPHRDEEAFASYLSRTRGWLENREASPGYWFGLEFSKRYTLDHPRRRPMTVDMLDQVDLDRALAVYSERFADASDFTFALVGKFDPADVRPLVELWLGGLPAKNREESWRDVGVENPEQAVEFTVRRGIEPKSSVRLTFHGEAAWDPLASHLISSMADVLRIRLREVLREDMGGVYGVGVSASLSRRPRERYAVTISFGCDPGRVDELVDAVRGEIRRLRDDGPSSDHVARVREIQRRDREVQLERNGFWARTLLYYARNGLDPRDILEYEQKVEAVTAESVRDAARRYLDGSRYLLGVLYPADWPVDGEVSE
jgi:zinc protease